MGQMLSFYNSIGDWDVLALNETHHPEELPPLSNLIHVCKRYIHSSKWGRAYFGQSRKFSGTQRCSAGVPIAQFDDVCDHCVVKISASGFKVLIVNLYRHSSLSTAEFCTQILNWVSKMVKEFPIYGC